MNVIIKGMKMPNNCEECQLKQYDESYDDTVCPYSGIPTLNIGRQYDCPISELPPHGRLIDADALMETIRAHDYPLANATNSRDRGMFTLGIQQAVDEAKTIIDEDVEDDGKS